MAQLIKSLNLIFWGVLIIIFDFSYTSTTNGVGIKFDFINDFLGSIIVFIGIVNISKMELLDVSFKKKMNYCVLAAIFQILFAISDFFIYQTLDVINTLTNLMNLMIDWALVVFAGSMIILSTKIGLNASLRRWKIVKKLFFWINFLPFAILIVFSEIMTLTNGFRFYWQSEFGITGQISSILLMILVLLPIGYALYTINSMKQEIKENYNI